MDAHFILTSENLQTLGFGIENLTPIRIGKGKSLVPTKLTGIYEGKFALPLSVMPMFDMLGMSQTFLSSLDIKILTVENFQWWVDAEKERQKFEP